MAAHETKKNLQFIFKAEFRYKRNILSLIKSLKHYEYIFVFFFFQERI